MLVAPGFYALLILASLLHPLARNNQTEVLQHSLGFCPQLVLSTVKTTIKRVEFQVHGKWKCFDVCEFVISAEEFGDHQFHKICYYGQHEELLCQSRNSTAEDFSCHLKVNEIKQSVLLDLLQLEDLDPLDRPQMPTLTIKITRRSFELRALHAPSYLDSTAIEMNQSEHVSLNENTQNAIIAVFRGILSLLDVVMIGSGPHGVVEVPPPDHHEHPHHLCSTRNVHLTADLMTMMHKIKRILIVDYTDDGHGYGREYDINKDHGYLAISHNSLRPHRRDRPSFWRLRTSPNWVV